MRKCFPINPTRTRTVTIPPEDKKVLGGFFQSKTLKPIYEWADDNVVFPDSYPTKFPGPHDISLTPFLKEPLDAVLDPYVKRITILKSSQAMVTETIAQNIMRYCVCCNPQNILYVGGQQEKTEDMLDIRLIPGLQCGAALRRAFKNCKIKKNNLRFPDMMISITWSSSGQGLKGFSYDYILGDESSIWPGDALSKLLKRLETVPFGKLILFSAMDKLGNRPADQDPTLVEFKNSDARELMFPDPKTGNLFKFEMGLPEKGRRPKHGVKWDPRAKRENGTWDYKAVRETAHFVTPDGTVITDDDKKSLVKKAQWVPTNADAPSWHRGYRISAFAYYWRTFADMAEEFLESKRRGSTTLRIFILETLTEEWKEKEDSADESDLKGRVGEHLKGEHFSEIDHYKNIYIGKAKATFTTIDVQKDYFWCESREWVDGGDSGLIEFKHLITWDEIEATANEHKASFVYVDVGYAMRRQEVFKACATRGGFIPTKGSDSRLNLVWMKSYINPYEGTKKQSDDESICQIIYDTDFFKTVTMQLVRGELQARWMIHKNTEREYRAQVTAEEKIGGVWVMKRGVSQNHGFDTTVLQTLAATREGLLPAELIPAERQPTEDE